MEFPWDKQLNYDITAISQIWTYANYANPAELGVYASRILGSSLQLEGTSLPTCFWTESTNYIFTFHKARTRIFARLL